MNNSTNSVIFGGATKRAHSILFSILAALLIIASISHASAEDLDQGAKKVGHETGTAARKIGHEVKKVAKTVGHEVKKAAKKVGKVAKDGGKEFKHAVKEK